MYQAVDAYWAAGAPMWKFRRQNLRQGWGAGAAREGGIAELAEEYR
jgi:hypothetical protein